MVTPRRLRRSAVPALVLAFAAGAARDASAHFALRSPASWREQDFLGNPQKTGPCGDDGTAATTGLVTAYAPGETITITLDETIHHPGHYRVALAVRDRSELPAPPPVTPGATDCGSAPIMSPAVFPVLADGELVHTTPFTGTQSFTVTLPSDVTCERCTLQVLEFMSDHAAPCFYYHCADIAIGAGPACTVDGDCTDADVCTADRCGANGNCEAVPLGLHDVGPGFLGSATPAACASESVPAAVRKRFAQAEKLVERAAGRAAKTARLLGRAAARLAKAARRLEDAPQGRLTAECAAALAGAVAGAQARLACLQAAPSGPSSAS